MAQKTDIDTVSGPDASELCMASDKETGVLLDSTGLLNGRSWCIKPDFCLNKTLSPITPDRGEIKISFNLSSSLQCLFGEDCTSQTTYQLKNVVLNYRTQMSTQTKKEPLVMSVVSSVKNNISSNLTNLSVNNPITSSAVAMSFVRVSKESSNTDNYLDMDEVDISRMEFSFNDITSGSLISYPLESKPEILLNGLLAMNATTKWSVQWDKYYLAGFPYQMMMPNTKLGVLLNSNITNSTPHSVYMYFLGSIQV